MNSLPLTMAVGFLGNAVGIPTNATIRTRLSRQSRIAYTGANGQVLNIYQKSVTNGAPLQIDLTTGQINPLGESISSSGAFAHVWGVLIEHDVSSISSGITAFGGGSNEFTGVRAATHQDTLAAGDWTAFGRPSNKTGFVVNGTHKRIDIANSDAVNVATVNVFVFGSIT